MALLTNLSRRTPDGAVSIGLAVGSGVVAGVTLVFGALLIYGLGAGYFGSVSVPSPLNFVVAPVLLMALIASLWRLLGRVLQPRADASAPMRSK